MITTRSTSSLAPPRIATTQVTERLQATVFGGLGIGDELDLMIIPRQLGEALSDPDPAARRRAFEAKITIARIGAARAGPPIV